MSEIVVIVGAGAGISASLARKYASTGARIALLARSTEKLQELSAATGAIVIRCDAGSASDLKAAFEEVDRTLGQPTTVIYNAGTRLRGSLVDLDPGEVRKQYDNSAFGGFLVAQEAARRMIPKGSGNLFFTGATASLKGYSGSAAFAMSKFALRALAQSAARELGPLGIHVAHFIIDGRVRKAGELDEQEAALSPDAIAETYYNVGLQQRSAWSFEVEVRPWAEKF